MTIRMWIGLVKAWILGWKVHGMISTFYGPRHPFFLNTCVHAQL